MNRNEFLRTVAGTAVGITGTFTTEKLFAVDKAKKPNLLLILADDMGYSDAECYGGEIHTPNLSKLADNGIRFTQFYSTGRCWPSRACILTGYYAQQIGRDSIKGMMKRGSRPKWAPLLPEMLKPYQYQSYHSGKWHIDGTPLEGGFDRSWGVEKTECDWDRYFSSKVWQEDKYSAPVRAGEEYYSTIAIADHAIACLKLHKEQYPDKPFFSYIAFYSPHFPLHALQKDIKKYSGKYNRGWDKIRNERWKRMKKMGLINCNLSKSDPAIVPRRNLKPEQLKEVYGEEEASRAVPWDSLTDKQKNFQKTKMAIHAAMILRMDLEIGRIIEQLKNMGEYENTLILFASDNGASAEQINRGDKHHKDALPGSAKSYLCLGPGWSTAANTPFRFHKHWNHEGGISSPFIAHWKKGIKAKGELRHEPGHFIDIVPTVLDLAGNDNTDHRPGLSLVPSFTQTEALKHEYLWWAHAGNKAIRMGDWKLSAVAGKDWELYNLKNDRSEMNDLSTEYPEILQKLSKKWDDTAREFMKKLKIKKRRK